MGKRAVLFYLVYAFGAFVFFLYGLFPGEKLAVQLSRFLNPTLAPVKISMTDLILYPPLEVEGKDIVLSFPNGGQLLLDSLQLMPVWTTLWAQYKSVGFEIQLYQGRGAGTFRIPIFTDQGPPASMSTYDVDAQFNDVAIEQFHYGFPGGEVFLSSLLQGRLTLSKKPGKAHEGTGEITFSNCTIDMDHGLLPDFGLDQVHFSTVKITCRLQDNRLELLGCRATGPEMVIEMSGRVDLVTPLSKSRLDLKGHLKPDAGYLSGISQLPPMVSALLGRFKGKGIPFRIQGTVVAPGVTL